MSSQRTVRYELRYKLPSSDKWVVVNAYETEEDAEAALHLAQQKMHEATPSLRVVEIIERLGLWVGDLPRDWKGGTLDD